VQNEHNKHALYYGGRKTNKLVRCYQKSTLGVFRVELELHSGLLHDISTLDDLLYLPDVVYPNHFQFVAFDWNRLEQYLSRRPGYEGRRIIAGARLRSPSLQRVRRYLNKKGIVNVHRFFTPLAINDKAQSALERWARQFKKGAL
jgi:hypothetical protein